MPRYNARRDDNDSDLAILASGLGAWLTRTNWPTDYLCWFRDRWDLVEIKRPDKEGWASEYTPKQLTFRADAQRRGARLIVWRTRADVLAYVGAREAA
jgi:hypothetical protein